MGKKKTINSSSSDGIFSYLHNNIQAINNSKVFAGLMIITLNIVSKFVNIKLSKTMESYLKFSFSRNVLVFAIAWMGTRDIYIAFIITIVFIICMEHFFHEDSAFFILPNDFKEYHISLLDNEKINGEKISEEDIQKAKAILEKAKLQNKEQPEFQGYSAGTQGSF
jgi:hypothetical protein